MIPILRKTESPVSEGPDTTSDTFWASYSDLMAGLLMVFTLTTIITLLDIGTRLVEPTTVVQEWSEVVEEICQDQNLKQMKNVEIDCNTGALIISDKHLRFGFDRVELGREAEVALRRAVPKYMEIIFRYPEFLKRIEVIEISGHTDRLDIHNANPRVSRERAGRVLDYLMREKSMEPYVKFLEEKAITAGYSDTRFPAECTQDKCAAARRVEITIHLDHANVLRDFLRILKQIIG